MKDSMIETHYWLAINGASCAMSSFPMPATVTVAPRPKMLVEFPTHGEAKTAQYSLLTDSIAKCCKLMDKWRKRHDVVIKVCKTPERPTHGPPFGYSKDNVGGFRR